MADVTMPRLSDTMEEGTIASWLKKPGEEVKRGDVIAQIETDKATMDLTAFEGGTLQEILAPEGSTVPIGQPVARIGSAAARGTSGAADAGGTADAGGSVATAPSGGVAASSAEGATATPPGAESTQSETPASPEAKANVGAAPDPAAPPTPTDQPPLPARAAENGTAAAAEGKTRASPMARHIAAEHGLDLSTIQGTGPQGRVIRSDVEAALSASADGPQRGTPFANGDTQGSAQADGRSDTPVSAPPADGRETVAQPSATHEAGDERVALSQMRRTIARRMAESTRTIPHFFLTSTIDATDLVKLRHEIVAQTVEAGLKITFNDLIVKGAALALRKVPQVNVSFADDALIKHQHVNIGVAVATERGLVVPVIRDVDVKSVGQIARETRDLAERASAGKLQPADYSGGTFTISNLGMFGVEQFNAVINPPEAAILAVGAITREPAELDGQIALRERLKLTLSVDHRALDGAIGARYLQALKQLLEKPMLLLV